MASLKLLFRRARTLLWTAVSIVVISAAVLVGIGKLLMPFSANYKPQLEAWLSEEFGRPVELMGFEGEWKAFGPRITLRGMKLQASGASQSQVVIEEAAVDIRPLNALFPNKPLYQFRVIGAHFELFHRQDGRWELSGLGVSAIESGQSGSALRQLAQVGDVLLQDSSLRYLDEKLGIDVRLSGIRGRLQTNGEQIATEVKANLIDPDSNSVLGEVEWVFKLLLDKQQRMADASWQLSARELMPASILDRVPGSIMLLHAGRINTELWGSWTREGGHLVEGVIDLRDARLVTGGRDVNLDRVNTRLKLSHQSRGHWRLDFSDFRFEDGIEPWVAPRISIARNLSSGLGLWVSADQLPLSFPVDMTRSLMAEQEVDWPGFLPRKAAGTVQDLDLVLSAKWQILLATGSVNAAAVSDWDRWPDLSGLNARLSLGEGFGTVAVSSDALTLSWNNMFRDSLIFAMPGCALDLRWGGVWQVGIRNCELNNEDIAVAGDVVLSGNGGRPAIDANVIVPRGKVGNMQSYWPQRIIKPKVVEWLRRNLLAGEIHDGRFQIHGDLDHWPFRNGEGRFSAQANISNGVLDYAADWPTARALDVSLSFVGAGMSVSGVVGDMAGIRISSATASIEDLKKPLLAVQYSSKTELPILLDFLQASPLNENIDADLSRFDFAGPATTKGLLTVPLGATPGEVEVKGEVSLVGNSFFDPDSEIRIESIVGTINYDRNGFKGNHLDATYGDKPAILDIEGGRATRHSFRAEMNGRFDVQDVIPRFLSESYDALANIGGETDWQMVMTVMPPEEQSEIDNDKGNGNAVRGIAVLEISSDLRDVALNLPAPLHKEGPAVFPVKLSFPLSGESRILDLQLADRAVLRFDLGDQIETPRRALIHLGKNPPDMPAIGFLTITGNEGMVDLDGWIDLIVEGATKGQGIGGLKLEKGQVHADQLIFLDRLFQDVEMGFESVETVVYANFMGAGIDGKLSYTSNEQGPSTLNAEFERLVLAQPLTDGVNMQSDPADLPAVHLYAKSLQYAGVELGETRVEAYPTAQGFHFEKVDSTSDLLRVTARGNWSLRDGAQRSDFSIRMTSESLGSILQSMDISSSMEGGQTQLQFDAWWPGPPSSFALSRLNGEVEFSVSQGVINNVSSGSGRLLGLLSIQALPKRLALDFRDVFDSGFAFDDATGTFQMENGMARTEDLLLKSSSANILVSGSTDLVDQRYDQLMTIKPGVGNTLPIIGAIAGGPGGAAAGLALQGLLQKQLSEAMQVRYTIKGPWDEPSIDPVTDNVVDEG